MNVLGMIKVVDALVVVGWSHNDVQFAASLCLQSQHRQSSTGSTLLYLNGVEVRNNQRPSSGPRHRSVIQSFWIIIAVGAFGTVLVD